MASTGRTDRRPRVIWINIDGLNAAPFYELLDAGKLPNISKIFREPARVEEAVSVFPTVTMPCQASMATGCHPNKHGLIGNSWFDRYGKTPKFRNYLDVNSALTIYGFKLFGAPTVLLPPRAGPSFASRDMSGAAHTIYEEISLRNARSAVVFNQISRGARDWIRPTRLDIAQFALCHEGRLEFSHFERTTAKHMVSHLEKARKLPRLFMAYFPGLDGHTHRHGAKSQPGYIRTVLDPLIGMLTDTLSERRNLEEFTFLLTSDHGHADVNPNRRRQISSDAISQILREHGRSPFYGQSQESLRHFDAILMPQGGSFHIILKNKKTRHWYDAPSLRNDLIPSSLALMDASKQNRAGMDTNWIDIILLKDYDTKRYVVMREHKIYDPFKFFSTSAHNHKYPDGFNRISGHFHQRSADIILLSNYSQGFYFSHKDLKAGMHGNLCRDDSIVPIILAGPNIKSCPIQTASIIDVAPTIASIFDTRMALADGAPLDVLQNSHANL